MTQLARNKKTPAQQIHSISQNHSKKYLIRCEKKVAAQKANPFVFSAQPVVITKKGGKKPSAPTIWHIILKKYYYWHALGFINCIFFKTIIKRAFLKIIKYED